MTTWPMAQIRHITRFEYGDSLAAEHRIDGHVPVFGSNGPVGSHDQANTCGPAVVIGRKGSHGQVNYSPSPVFAIDTTYYVDESTTGHDLRWLYYALGTAGLTTLGQDVGVPGLNRDLAYGQRIPLPPLAEQRAIADYLDAATARIDALIAKKQQLIHLLEERWVTQRDDAILRGCDPVAGTGQLPEGWARPQLGVIIELQRGHDLPADERRDGPFPVVSSGGVSGYHDEWACRGPAVVTGRYGTVGEVYYVEEDCWPLNTTLYVKDFRGNDPRWVAFMLESLPLDAESEKSAVGGINRNVIGKLRVPHPTFDIQQGIATRLAKARATRDAASRALASQIDLLAEHRQALITAAVTGELAVPTAA